MSRLITSSSDHLARTIDHADIISLFHFSALQIHVSDNPNSNPRADDTSDIFHSWYLIRRQSMLRRLDCDVGCITECYSSAAAICVSIYGVEMENRLHFMES